MSFVNWVLIILALLLMSVLGLAVSPAAAVDQEMKTIYAKALDTKEKDILTL